MSDIQSSKQAPRPAPHPVPGGVETLRRDAPPRSPATRVRLALKLLVSVGLLGWMFTWIPLAGVWDALRAADAAALWLALLMLVATQLIAARQTRMLTSYQGMTLSTFDHFRIAAATAFYRLALPGGMGGGLIRWYKMSRQDRKPLETFNVMMYDRVINALVMVLLGGLYLLWDWPFGAHPLAWGSVAVLLVGLAFYAGLYLVIFNGRMAAWVNRRIARWLPVRWREPIGRLAASADGFTGLGTSLRAKVWGYSVAGRLVNLAMYYYFIQALAIPLGFVTMAWVRTVVALLVLIPVSFSGIGVREGAMLMLLAPYGVEPEQIVAFSMLIFIALLLYGVVGGLFELADVLAARKWPRAAASPITSRR